MKKWPIEKSKSKFSQIMKAAWDEGPQTLTRNGEDFAVMVSIDEWKRVVEQGDEAPTQP
jgi:prevent-host-death family protein